MNTLNELSKYIGWEATYSINGLAVVVLIKDIRQAYGRTDYLIEPVRGSGNVWVSGEKLSI